MALTTPALLALKLSALLVLLHVTQLRLVQAQYQLAREYAGNSFFDRWQFYDHCEFRFTGLCLSFCSSSLRFFDV